MRLIETVAQTREQVRAWRGNGERIALVPTMGNLHAGHFALVEIARRHADRVIATVFVNPTQFGPNEDFARYPRTLDADRAGLASAGCHALFAPSVGEMYPLGTAEHVRIEVPVLGETLCGAFRPGHFAGVATVVAKLFGMVVPDVAVFGAKDYQQLLVIRRLVADLAMPIEIVAAPTVREANGLAMSSRNQYLSDAERRTAATIHATLQRMANQAREGRELAQIEAQALADLVAAGFRPDYAAIRRADTLGEWSETTRAPRIALIAAWLGKARLIDNLLIDKV